MHERLRPPAEVFDEAGRRLGSQIAERELLAGGYTPQSLFRLKLADGRYVVLKAAPPAAASRAEIDWHEILRREIHVYREVPHLDRWRPRFFGDFEAKGWFGLLLEDLSNARRVPPWNDEEVETCARGLAEMHAATLEHTATLERAATLEEAAADTPLHEQAHSRFALIRERAGQRGSLPQACDRPDWWRWIDEAARRGAALFDEPQTQTEPLCYIHYDVRSDNLFLRDGRLLLVDWPDAARQTPFLDSVYWALGVETEAEHLTASDAHARYLAHARLNYLADARLASARGIKQALAFCAAYFVSALQADGSPPHVQALRLRYLSPTLRWFAREFDLDAPPLD